MNNKYNLNQQYFKFKQNVPLRKIQNISSSYLNTLTSTIWSFDKNQQINIISQLIQDMEYSKCQSINAIQTNCIKLLKSITNPQINNLIQISLIYCGINNIEILNFINAPCLQMLNLSRNRISMSKSVIKWQFKRINKLLLSINLIQQMKNISRYRINILTQHHIQRIGKKIVQSGIDIQDQRQVQILNRFSMQDAYILSLNSKQSRQFNEDDNLTQGELFSLQSLYIQSVNDFAKLQLGLQQFERLQYNRLQRKYYKKQIQKQVEINNKNKNKKLIKEYNKGQKQSNKRYKQGNKGQKQGNKIQKQSNKEQKQANRGYIQHNESQNTYKQIHQINQKVNYNENSKENQQFNNKDLLIKQTNKQKQFQSTQQQQNQMTQKQYHQQQQYKHNNKQNQYKHNNKQNQYKKTYRNLTQRQKQIFRTISIRAILGYIQFYDGSAITQNDNLPLSQFQLQNNYHNLYSNKYKKKIFQLIKQQKTTISLFKKVILQKDSSILIV